MAPPDGERSNRGSFNVKRVINETKVKSRVSGRVANRQLDTEKFNPDLTECNYAADSQVTSCRSECQWNSKLL